MKTILYYTDLMPFLSNPAKAVAKVKKNFEIFQENKDQIELIWHPYRRTEEFLILNNCECLEEYRKLKENFMDRNIGSFDESDDGKKLADLCDAYYGDYSDITYYFTENKKPVMIQNIDIQ